MSQYLPQCDLDSHIQAAVHAIDTATPTDTSFELACSIASQYDAAADAPSHYEAETIAASCYYCAAKLSGNPLHPADVTTVETVSAEQNTILDVAQDIATTLNIHPRKFSDSTPYVTHYCEILDLPEHVSQRAQEIVTTLKHAPESSGHSPTGWAAAAVYTAAVETHNVSVSQTDVADIAHVSPVTVRTNHYLQIELLDPDNDTVPTTNTPTDSEPDTRFSP